MQAMVATAAVHSADEAAQRILPAVSPLAVDQIQEVRHAALACIQTFSQILSDHSRTLDDALNAAGADCTVVLIAKLLRLVHHMMQLMLDITDPGCRLIPLTSQGLQAESCSKVPQLRLGLWAWAATLAGLCHSLCGAALALVLSSLQAPHI